MKLLKSNESSYTSTALLRTKSSSEFHGGGEGREPPMTGKRRICFQKLPDNNTVSLKNIRKE